MNGALKNIKIIDLSRVLAGPYCTMILGDMGAEVIKVEDPLRGDETREWGPPFVKKESAYYLCANRNKKGMTLNLKSAEGFEIMKRLVQNADVVVHNFKPGTMERFGLHYEQLKKWNQGIILASISGFGKSNSSSHLPGYDYLIQGMSGLMSITGSVENGPQKVGVAIEDVITGLYTCIGILGAINHKHHTSEGQELDISLLDCGLAAMVNVASNYLLSGTIPQPLGNQHPNIVPYQTFMTKNGHIIIAIGNDSQFVRFMNMIGLDDPCLLEKYQTNAKRLQNKEELIRLIQQSVEGFSKEELQLKLDLQGIPNSPIYNVEEALNSKQVKEREMVITMEHKTISNLKLVGSPLKFSNTQIQYQNPPPLKSQHTEEILLSLGYDTEDIKEMKENQII